MAASLWGTASLAQTWPPLPPARPPDTPGRLLDQGAASAPDTGAGRTAAGPPLPPTRPPQFGPDQPQPVAPAPPTPLPPAPTPPPAAPTWVGSGQTIRNPPQWLVPGAFPVDQMDAACTRILASGKVAGRRQASILGANGCGIAYPLTLEAVVLPDGGRVTLHPAPILRCDLAEVLADWIRQDLAQRGGNRGRLTDMATAAAYVCRGRNNVLGAPMSEHGRGDAIDVLGLRFANASVLIGQPGASDLWATVKDDVCTRFMTVLGPGSDGYHENNLHLDLENRRNGSHYCHWDHP